MVITRGRAKEKLVAIKSSLQVNNRVISHCLLRYKFNYYIKVIFVILTILKKNSNCAVVIFILCFTTVIIVSYCFDRVRVQVQVQVLVLVQLQMQVHMKISLYSQ